MIARLDSNRIVVSDEIMFPFMVLDTEPHQLTYIQLLNALRLRSPVLFCIKSRLLDASRS